MHILNRLTKLETLASDSTVCECADTPKTEFIRQREGESIEIPVAHLCNKCGKPVDGVVIIIQGVDKTTKERFADEWQAANKKD
jgi:hypothetical protein